MNEKNVTLLTTIHLLGFKPPLYLTWLVFLVFLIIYWVTICGNLLIISLVSCHETLHSPMYFFLSQLSLLDISLETDILPNMLHGLLVMKTIMSFSNCVTQFYFFGIFATAECLLLTVMSYARYLAICKPLHYTSIMTHRICWIIVVIGWLLSFEIPLYVISLTELKFCGLNVIDHFYCDLNPILELACSDITIVQLEVALLGGVFEVLPSSIIIVSYIYIIVTIFRIPSVTGRKKVFSTCSSHLTSVSVYYGTLFGVYLAPSKGEVWNVNKFLSLLYTVVTPMINPIIYSLRNEELKNVFGNLINIFLNIHRKRLD
ncbi:LOW QUALITY PROTEIN: olfactory receptor 5G9-like [Gastrophryne carolinensis]